MPLIIIGSVVVAGLLISYFGTSFFNKPDVYQGTVIAKNDWNGDTWSNFVGNRFIARMGKPLRITFDLGNGQNINLLVPKKIYDNISIGNVGTLEVDGELLKKFTV